MAIARIRRLRDCGVFRDFTWPGNLPEFGRYNLIYGWNGSGKTTLSRLFRALEARTAPPSGEVSVTIGDRDVSRDEFGEATLAIRVFNRDFMAESVFPTGREVAPIFVLGKENVEKQKQVEVLKAKLTEEQAKLGASRQSKTSAESALDQFCIDKAKAVKDTLRSAGSNPYNNYDKGDFRRRSEVMIAAGDHPAHALSSDARETLLTQLHATPKPKLASLAYRLPALKMLGETVSALLSTTVVSAAIQSLKDDAVLSSWVHAGLGIHREREAQECLFCGRPAPENRLVALEAHFSTEYETFLSKLDDQILVIQAAIDSATKLSVPSAAQFYDDLSSEYEGAAATLRGELDCAKRVLEALVRAMEDKKNRAFERLALNVVVPALNDGAIDYVNQVVLKHNQACDAFQSRIEAARTQLEADLTAENLNEFVGLGRAARTADEVVGTATDRVKQLSGEITALEREIVEHRQPAEELNADLHSYLGHSELHLEIKATGYTITRHDGPAESLSEGEMTAIALLYFLKSLQDRRFDLTQGVVVLDDPVSSLDANALYSAFGFIRERTQNAAQLIILTHNFAFFRQVRNWFRHLKDQKKRDVAQRPARFYMLDCTHEQDRRCAGIRWLDPLLDEFESEYHYLFACIYRTAIASPQPNLEQNYMLPNLARRLLEAFLAFRQPHLSGELWQKLRLVKFDEAKKIRVIRFLHTHSHNAAFGEPEHDLSLMSEAQAVLRDLLALMQAEDSEHFSAMVSLVETREEIEETGEQ